MKGRAFVLVADATLNPALGLKTSSLVTTSESMPLIIFAYRRTARSSQPQRLGRPVTAPNSLPRSRTSRASRSGISVGKGPPPTRVVYALETPRSCLILVGGTPTPVVAPPEVALDDVT